jgi:hypothetical protein
MSLKSKDGKLLARDGHLCTTCCSHDLLSIIYEWDPPSRDLDTGTTFLGSIVGWSCGNSGLYITWSSGDNTSYGPEEVIVDVIQALSDGAWVSSVEINCSAGWYSPAGGSGPARLRVTFHGITQEISITPGSQSSCATTPVGLITVHDDLTFTLTAP